MPNWIDVAIRSIFTMIGLFFVMRLIGKKQVATLSFFEYIVGITVGDLAAGISSDTKMPLSSSITSLAIWVLFPITISLISLKNKTIRDIAENKTTVVIKNGKIMEGNLKKEKYTADDLLVQLRKRNVFQVADVEFATLEPSGDINVLLKREKQPLTFGDIYPNAPSVKEPQTVIMDGKILDESLATMRLNRGWVKEELDKIGVTIENVFLAQVDSYGELSVDLFEDKIQVPASVTKKLIQASINKCIADLELFALQTESTSAKEMYTKNSEKMKEIKDKVVLHLKN